MFVVQAIRVIVAIVNAYCLVVLGVRYARYRCTWKPETRDLWITLTFWSAAALVITIQGWIQKRPLSVGFIALGIASLATPIVLRRKKREHSTESYLDG